MSLPRAELYAALLNTHNGEVVKRSFYKHHKNQIKLTDSQIILHWIRNEERPLKQWVRNRVVEIRRFTFPKQWYYVQSKNMIADIGTRKGAHIKDVNQTSTWINGYKWMQGEFTSFPIKTVNQINLYNTELREVKLETYNPSQDTTSFHSKVFQQSIPEEVLERYTFCSYLIDPNRYRFKKVVRILAIVMKFCKLLLQKSKSVVKSSKDAQMIYREMVDRVYITEREMKVAEKYFYRKCTLEIKQFVPVKKYEKFAKEKDEVLTYTGRILPTNEILVTGNFTSAMKDLSSTTFCVPVIDKNSPVAFSIVNEVHWCDAVAKHAGIETVSRYVLKKVYIIEGRSLVKLVKKKCLRCHYLAKKTVDVIMGPISDYNLSIAPVYYLTQVDLAGPFKAYSAHQKRTTIKIWLAVFCCSTTSSTNIKIMDDYSSTSFIQAFIRFSCDVGYPKVLLPDAGGQLVKSCETMKFNFKDIKNKLYHDFEVEFEVCPVGGHNMHGRVERKIKEIKSSLEKSISNERLSILQWETVSSEIANGINNLPLAIGNVTTDFETLDLITPNRLKLGRNNERSPVGSMLVTSDPKRIFKEIKKYTNLGLKTGFCHMFQN